MRLAENADAIADCTSIREADMKLRQPREPKPGECGYEESTHDESAEDDSDESSDDAQRVVQRQSASPDLTATLRNVGVDEVCTALTQAWDREQLDDLFKRLGDHLRSLEKTLSIPTQLRRAPSAPPVPPS
jgi:hypothetical protein